MKRSIFVSIIITLIMGNFCCKPIKPVPLTPFIDGKNFMLNKPLVYRMGNTSDVITVPNGFVTDFASIPRPFYSIFLPTGPYQWAAVVHDFLYWKQSTSRLEADKIFLNAMKESGVNLAKRIAIYEAVRLGGEKPWNNNLAEKKKGLPRIIPVRYQNIPANTSWPEYRMYLYKNGVRP